MYQAWAYVRMADLLQDLTFNGESTGISKAGGKLCCGFTGFPALTHLAARDKS